MVFCGRLQAYAFLVTFVVSWKLPTILLALHGLDTFAWNGKLLSAT